MHAMNIYLGLAKYVRFNSRTTGQIVRKSSMDILPLKAIPKSYFLITYISNINMMDTQTY
jgi:hypothetical protein